MSPDEQVPLTRALGTRTRTRRAGERGRRAGPAAASEARAPPPTGGSARPGAAGGRRSHASEEATNLPPTSNLLSLATSPCSPLVFHATVVTCGQMPTLSLQKFHCERAIERTHCAPPRTPRFLARSLPSGPRLCGSPPAPRICAPPSRISGSLARRATGGRCQGP